METKVMKIMWTIAALACSVSLVDAQQSAPPARRPGVAKPASPAPTPRPRVQITEPMEWLLEPPAAALAPLPALEPMEPLMALAPGQNWLPVAPWEPLTPFPPLEALSPMTPLEPLVPLTPMVPQAPMAPLAMPGQMSIDWSPLPGEMSLIDPPTPRAAPSPLGAPTAIDALPARPAQGPVTPRPREREMDAELRRLMAEVDRAEAARVRAAEAQDRTRQRELEAQERNLERQLEQRLRVLEQQDRNAQRQLEQQLANAARQAEQADRNAQRQVEQQLANAARQAEQADRNAQRQLEQQIAQTIRQQEMQDRQIQREHEQMLRELRLDVRPNINFDFHWNGDFRPSVPAGWAKQDVADSVWNRARELLNRGEWGQALSAFRSIPTRYPNSQYAPDASYWQAFALFRIGGTSELREGLSVIEAARTKYPNAQRKTEMASLATRIRGVLASRGDAQAAAELRAAGEQGATCDREEQSVQAEAMNQLSRMEGGNINELITRVLARKDECAVPLRKAAVFLIGNRRDAQAVTTLSSVARTDPNVEVRLEAISVISRLGSEEGVAVLEEMTRSDDERIQRTAVRALVRHPSARARASVRTMVEREETSERLRSEALSAFDSERATADDIAWLRALYNKVTTPTLKARTLSAITRVGGPEVDQWLVTIASDDNQPSEIRATAMRRIGTTMSIADLGKLYDAATNRRFRSEVINVLGKRKEDAATDKLIEIVKTGTDPSLRTSALQAVSSKGDARSQQLLLEIINK
jgi:HEAT repeat protein